MPLRPITSPSMLSTKLKALVMPMTQMSVISQLTIKIGMTRQAEKLVWDDLYIRTEGDQQAASNDLAGKFNPGGRRLKSSHRPTPKMINAGRRIVHKLLNHRQVEHQPTHQQRHDNRNATGQRCGKFMLFMRQGSRQVHQTNASANQMATCPNSRERIMPIRIL